LGPLALLPSASYICAALIMQILVAHALFGIGAALLLSFGGLHAVLRFGDDSSSPRDR
jgi:hypothetical protein